MLTLDLEDFMVELKDGAVKHVGTKRTAAAVKLYHVTAASAREFGDSQVKLEFADDEGNEIQIALDAEAASALGDELAELRDESPVFE